MKDCLMLEGAEDAVAGISEARDDVGAFVELFIESGDEDVNVGMRVAQYGCLQERRRGP